MTWLLPQVGSRRLWGVAAVVNTHNGKQQKAVLWPEIYTSRAEALRAVRVELGVFAAKPAAASRLMRRRGLHVVEVHLRTSTQVPRRPDQ